MKNKRNSLKWIIGVLCLLLISCFIYGVYIYHTIQQNKTAAFEQVKKEVVQETDLDTIDKVERFHGDKAYYIVYGQTNDKKQKIVFYPFDMNNEDLTIVSKSEIISKESIQNNWSDSCRSCELYDVTPALVGDKPSWEITFTDESNRYVIDYLSIYDGTQVEQFRLKHMFE